MLGLFGVLGRSRDLQRLDASLRDRGLHPHLMPDAVKLTVLKLLQEETGRRSPSAAAHEAASALLVYCQLGAESYAEENGGPDLDAVEGRLEEALEAGDGLDARLVLLMLHSGMIEPSVVERFDLGVA